MATRAPKSKKSGGKPASGSPTTSKTKAKAKATPKPTGKRISKPTPKSVAKPVAKPSASLGGKKASKKVAKKVGKQVGAAARKKSSAKVVAKSAPKAPAKKISPVRKPVATAPKPAAAKASGAKASKPTVDRSLVSPAPSAASEIAAAPTHAPTPTPPPGAGPRQPVKLSSDPETRKRQQADLALEFAIEAARLCRDDKCTDVVLLDVRGLSSVSDYIIVGSGTSDRQMKSVLDHVAELGQTFGFTQSRTNSDERSTWLLIDFVDVMVHLFEPTTRAHYDIEMLWGDAPRLEWERPDQIDRDRAGLSRTSKR